MCRKLNKEMRNQKKAEKILSRVDYENLDPMNRKENMLFAHSNNISANNLGLGVDFLIEIVKSIGFSQLNTLINSWINPAEKSYAKEILDKVNEIERNVEQLTRITQLQAYQSVLNDRRKDLIGLSTVSNSYFTQLLILISRGLDPEGRTFKEVLGMMMKEWSSKICCGTNVYYEVENLLKLYINPNVMNNKSYPEIYDEVAYFSTSWESKGYAFRRSLRSEDYYVILSNIMLATYYYNLKNDEDSKYHLEQLEKLLTEYQKIFDSHPVIVNQHMKCQIPGAEMEFEPGWLNFDWYNQTRKCEVNHIDIRDEHDNGKRYLHYDGYDQNWFLTREEAITIYNYYGGKNWVDICNDASTDEVKFYGFDGGKWNVIQGQIEYDIHMFRKNKDQIFTWAFPFAGVDQDPKRDVQTHTIEHCNLSYAGTSQEAWPPLYVTNSGNVYGNRSFGFFKIVKRGR